MKARPHLFNAVFSNGDRKWILSAVYSFAVAEKKARAICPPRIKLLRITYRGTIDA